MASSVTNGTRRQSGNNLLSIDTNGQRRQSKNLSVDAFFQNNIRTLSGYALNRKSLVPSDNPENGDIYLIVPEGKQQKRRISCLPLFVALFSHSQFRVFVELKNVCLASFREALSALFCDQTPSFVVFFEFDLSENARDLNYTEFCLFWMSLVVF